MMFLGVDSCLLTVNCHLSKCAAAAERASLSRPVISLIQLRLRLIRRRISLKPTGLNHK